MTHFHTRHNPEKRGKAASLQSLARLLLAPVPIALYQPLLNKIITHVIQNNQGVFQRLGNCANKTLVIKPTNMPFALVLQPNPYAPSLRAIRNFDSVTYDAIISGSLLSLMRMVDGQLDGDSLFFTRDLTIHGDTEAIVSLRNALDNMDHSLAEDISSMFGSIGRIALYSLRHLPTK
jgi:predicted lipid carrier protein YhbT